MPPLARRRLCRALCFAVTDRHRRNSCGGARRLRRRGPLYHNPSSKGLGDILSLLPFTLPVPPPLAALRHSPPSTSATRRHKPPYAPFSTVLYRQRNSIKRRKEEEEEEEEEEELLQVCFGTPPQTMIIKKGATIGGTSLQTLTIRNFRVSFGNLGEILAEFLIVMSGWLVMSKGFYVVWVGKEPGIYNTWSECEKQTKGVSNAKHKKFKSYVEAKQAYDNPPPGYNVTCEGIDKGAGTGTDEGAGTCAGGSSGTVKLIIQEGGDKKLILEGHVDDVCEVMNKLNL